METPRITSIGLAFAAFATFAVHIPSASAVQPSWQNGVFSAKGSAPDVAAAGPNGPFHLVFLSSGEVRHVVLSKDGDLLAEETEGAWAGVGNGWTFSPGVAVTNEGVVHLAWASPIGDWLFDAFYTRKINGAWEAPVLLQGGILRGYAPQVAADASGASVVIHASDDVPFADAIHHRVVNGTSTDKGGVAPSRVDDRMDILSGPADGELHLFSGVPNPSGHIEYRHSVDAGAGWNDLGTVEASPCGGRVGQPDAARVGPDVHLVYGCASDGDLGGAPSVRHTRLVGTSPTGDQAVTSPGELTSWHLNLGISRIAASPAGHLLVAYLTYDAGELRTIWSEDAGATWSAPETVAAEGGDAEGRNVPSAAAAGEVFLLAWSDGKQLKVARAEFETCTSICGGKNCGDDGCGGQCGQCAVGDVCTGAGICEPEPPPPPPPEVEAAYVPGMADGDISEWGAVHEIPIPSPQGWGSVAGLPAPAPSDLTAYFKLGWSNDTLRAAIFVLDDAHTPHGVAGELWKGDSVQLAVDVLADAAAGGGYGSDDWEIGVANLDGTVMTDCYVVPASVSDCPVVAAVSPSVGLTVYEIDVPHAALVATLGLSVLINEDDGDGREGWLEWTPGIGLTKDPSQFGTVHLVGEAPPSPDSGEGPAAEDATNSDVGPASDAQASGAEISTEPFPVWDDLGDDEASSDPDSDGCAGGPGRSGSLTLLLVVWLAAVRVRRTIEQSRPRDE